MKSPGFAVLGFTGDGLELISGPHETREECMEAMRSDVRSHTNPLDAANNVYWIVPFQEPGYRIPMTPMPIET